MSAALITAALWALAATLTALLPMRLQYKPGLTLLIAAPFLLIWLALTHNIWLTIAALLGFMSMFRNPLIYIYRQAVARRTGGPHPEIPK